MNTISKHLIEKYAEKVSKDFEEEMELLEKMDESDKIAYLAAKSTFTR